MRVPAYTSDPGWQRFFAGTAAGAIISWVLFLFLFGQIQEKNIQEIITQQAEIADLEERIKVFNEENIKMNKKNGQALVVEGFTIQLTNVNKLKLDLLTIHLLKESVEDQLKDLISQDIESLSKSKALIIKTIENHTFKIDDQQYKLEVTQMVLYTTLELTLKVSKA